MAGQGYKLFVNGNTLSASDLNTYVQQQTVMVFATTGARTTALASVLAEGMVSYVTGTGLQYYTGSAWVNIGSSFAGSSSGSTLLQASAVASGTLTLPAATDTLVGQATTDTLTNKTLTAPKINLGINAQTGTTYTTVLGDNGQLITLNNASAITVSIPTNASVAYPIGTQINFAWITGAGQPTIQAVTSGTTTILSTGASSIAPKLRAVNSTATCMKILTDTWIVAGDIA